RDRGRLPAAQPAPGGDRQRGCGDHQRRPVRHLQMRERGGGPTRRVRAAAFDVRRPLGFSLDAGRHVRRPALRDRTIARRGDPLVATNRRPAISRHPAILSGQPEETGAMLSGNRANGGDHYDVAICGGGLAGLALARQLRLQLPQASVAVVEKLPGPVPEAAFKVGESTTEAGSYYLAETLQLREYLAKHHLFKLGLRFFFGNSRGAFHERPEFGLSDF